MFVVLSLFVSTRTTAAFTVTNRNIASLSLVLDKVGVANKPVLSSRIGPHFASSWDITESNAPTDDQDSDDTDNMPATFIVDFNADDDDDDEEEEENDAISLDYVEFEHFLDTNENNSDNDDEEEGDTNVVYDGQEQYSNDTDETDGGEDEEILPPPVPLEPLERAWRHVKKPLLRIGNKGATAAHGNSLRQLLDAHTTVKVKINTHKLGNLEEAFGVLKGLAEESGADDGIELLKFRESEKTILVGLPGTLERIDAGEFPVIKPKKVFVEGEKKKTTTTTTTAPKGRRQRKMP